MREGKYIYLFLRCLESSCGMMAYCLEGEKSTPFNIGQGLAIGFMSPLRFSQSVVG